MGVVLRVAPLVEVLAALLLAEARPGGVPLADVLLAFERPSPDCLPVLVFWRAFDIGLAVFGYLMALIVN